VKLMQETAEVDLGNLAVIDPTPLDKASFKKNREAFIQSHTRAAMQLLFQKLDQLPREEDKQGVYLTLPACSISIPREKPLPKPKPPTRWEKFAEQKGIQKRKRGRMVFDEDSQEYKPRYGMGRIGEDQKKGDWLMLGNNSKGNDHDPYAERLEKKQTQKSKQKMQEERNVKEAGDQGYKGPLTVGGKLAGKHENMDKTSAKESLTDALLVAQRSTGSMGKFDRRVKDEPELKKIKGKRRKLENSVHGDLAGEKGKSLKVLDKMIGGSADASFNQEKAGNIHQQIVNSAMAEKRAQKETRAGGLGKNRRSSTGKTSKFSKGVKGKPGKKKK